MDKEIDLCVEQEDIVTGYLKVRITFFQAKVNWQASSIRTNMSLTFAYITKRALGLRLKNY